MDKQLKMLELLFDSLIENFRKYAKEEETNVSYFNANYMNKNHGKVALKRKITLIRQELLNLEKMLDE